MYRPSANNGASKKFGIRNNKPSAYIPTTHPDFNYKLLEFYVKNCLISSLKCIVINLVQFIVVLLEVLDLFVVIVVKNIAPVSLTSINVIKKYVHSLKSSNSIGSTTI